MPNSRRAKAGALHRGLDFIYRCASDPAHFEDYGFDFLFSFNWIASTSADPVVRSRSREMGRERARYWRRTRPRTPERTDADTIAQLVFANYSADRLGTRDSDEKKRIRGRASRFTGHDYFWFDPKNEPPPSNVPADCSCGADNPRGSSNCRLCKSPLVMISRYEVWLLALIRSYLGERYGAQLGARYREVIKWLPAMRPYPKLRASTEADFIWSIYAVTHVVYTLNGYGSFRLSPRWLPSEHEFLRSNLERIIAMRDPETVGEMLDSLKSFGLGDRNRLICSGVDYLLSCQNPDGSWGETEVDDIYDRYHPTLTAINGLRDYQWKGTRLVFPHLESFLAGSAGGG